MSFVTEVYSLFNVASGDHMDERSFWPCARHIDTKIRGDKNKMKLHMKERLKVTQTNDRLIFTLERKR